MAAETAAPPRHRRGRVACVRKERKAPGGLPGEPPGPPRAGGGVKAEGHAPRSPSPKAGCPRTHLKHGRSTGDKRTGLWVQRFCCFLNQRKSHNACYNAVFGDRERDDKESGKTAWSANVGARWLCAAGQTPQLGVWTAVFWKAKALTAAQRTGTRCASLYSSTCAEGNRPPICACKRFMEG